MSDSKQHLDPTTDLPFIHNHPISFSHPDHNVFDPHLQTHFSPTNDSNSDDTQFEIQNTQLTSNDTTPVKDKTSHNRHTHHQSPQLPTNFSSLNHHRSSPDEQLVPENNLPPQKENNSLNNPDHSDFVDYFLAHDDFLQALDDYSRSVGQTSSFPLEIPSAFPAQHYHSPTASFTPVPNDQTDSFSTTMSIAKRAALVPGDAAVNASSRATNPPRTNAASKVQRTSPRNDLKQPRSVPLPRRSEKRKPRTYSQAIPSQHCHICSRRPTETSPHAVCGNLLKGRCRKTICTKCFHQFRWDLKAAREAPPGTWECPHCRGECPQRAQCVIYNRTSDRRRMKLINHRKKKDQTKASSSRKLDANRKPDGKAESMSDSPNSGTTLITPFSMLNSRSPTRSGVSQRNFVKSERKSAETKGISKSIRVSGLSSHGSLALIAEGIHENALTNWSTQRKRDVSDLASSSQKTPAGLAKKVEGNETSKEMMVKTETGILGQVELDEGERNGCEDVAGVFGYMNLPNDILGTVSEEHQEKGMSAIAGGGDGGLDANLSLLDIDESGQCDQVRLRMWDEDETKYEQVDTADFPFQENVLDLDTFG